MNKDNENYKSIGFVAAEFLDNDYTCLQSVFLALKSIFDELDKIDENIFSGFGGGFACTGNTCGTIVVQLQRFLYILLTRRIIKIEKNCIHNCKSFMKISKKNLAV
ncbi:hypothetical protein [endosymbiont 'TC1' of Trimyema compressum]|uniref:hypothetical protein n=1 Tax=endosymbiont 'TC1' of Trimyema compressum TaxID=243899 RepID=UPI001FE1FA85|nr:hypothetical protein [endosymbiont 'TC1' of Trimyema compressum]